jgi:hypothetical protein
METFVINIKNKKDSKLIKELLNRLDVKIGAKETEKMTHKSKSKSEEEFRALAGSAKGLLISKDHLRNLSWKKRDW